MTDIANEMDQKDQAKTNHLEILIEQRAQDWIAQKAEIITLRIKSEEEEKKI